MNEKIEESEKCMQVYKTKLIDIPLAIKNIAYHPISNRTKISATKQKLFEQVHELIETGMGVRKIARELGVNRDKIRILAQMKELQGKQI